MRVESRTRTNVRKNDTVIVIAGRERGKTGKVLRVLSDRTRVIVERLNVAKRHTRARGQQLGGIVEKELPIHASNLMILCDKCHSPTRIGKKLLAEGRKARFCKRCGETIES
jgi:large subunit ribosomal protein L24